MADSETSVWTGEYGFNAADLTMSIDDFHDRMLAPAIRAYSDAIDAAIPGWQFPLVCILPNPIRRRVIRWYLWRHERRVPNG